MSDTSRREFCAHAGYAVSLLALGAVLPGCGGGSPTSPSSGTPLAVINASVSGTSVVATLDSSSPLATSGGVALIRSSRGTFLAARGTGDAVTVLSATCTHETCEITSFDAGRYTCPCHGSRFTTEGAVVNGPANRSLPRFSAQLAGTVLTISA